VIGPPPRRIVALVPAFLLLLALGGTALGDTDWSFLEEAEGSAPDKEPPVVVMLAPQPTSDDQAIVIRALVQDDSGVDAVTFWMKDSNGADYRPVKMIRAQDGAYLTWFPATDERRIRFYVEAWDKLGNGPGTSGSPSAPHHVRALEEAQAGRVPLGTYLLAAVLVALLNFFLLQIMQRYDRVHRVRSFWYRLLAPLVYKRGADLLRAVDRILAWMRGKATPAGQEIERLEVLKWLGCLHAERRERVRAARKARVPEEQAAAARQAARRRARAAARPTRRLGPARRVIPRGSAAASAPGRPASTAATRRG
jgi:hypothetical protein